MKVDITILLSLKSIVPPPAFFYILVSPLPLFLQHSHNDIERTLSWSIMDIH